MWINEVKMWYNVCLGGIDNIGDDGVIMDFNLLDYFNKELDIFVLLGNFFVMDVDCCFQDLRNFLNFFILNSWLGNFNIGSLMCIGKWNKGMFFNDIEVWVDEWCL